MTEFSSKMMFEAMDRWIESNKEARDGLGVLVCKLVKAGSTFPSTEEVRRLTTDFVREIHVNDVEECILQTVLSGLNILYQITLVKERM